MICMALNNRNPGTLSSGKKKSLEELVLNPPV